jgi:PAS domain S-box-containing protein
MTNKPTYEELEVELRKSEEKLSGVIDSIADHMSMMDRQHNILWANEVAKKLFGPNLVGKKCYASYHGYDKPCEPCIVSRCFEDEKVHEHETKVIGTDGENVDFWCIASIAERHEDGRPKTVVEISRNTTEIKKINVASRESEERFRSTFEQAAIGIAHVFPEGHFLRINQRFCDIVGYTKEEMLKLAFQDITHPDDLDIDLEYVREMLSGEIQTYSMEKRYFKKNGSIVWVNLTVSLVRKTSGEPKYFISAVENINQQKQAEAALQKTHDELKERTKNLEIKTKSLEEINTAMNILLKKREEDKTEIEKNVLTNVKELVMPFVDKFRETQLDGQQKTFLSIIESNLNEVISPFTRRLSLEFLALTPTEIKIANMTRHGNTSKKIAKIMNISPRTVDTHKKNIRGKIGLRGKRANLRSFLLSLH